MSFDDARNPYADRDGHSYQYDNHVQNHKQVETGDLLFVRSRTSLEGVGRISRIEASSGEKTLACCPRCGRPVLRGSAPQLRCKSGHVFPEPEYKTIGVTKYRALFGGDWLPVKPGLSTVEIKRFYLRRSTLAIMPANRDGLIDFVGGWSPEVHDRLLSWSGRTPRLTDDAADNEPDLTPWGEDRRRAALRLIRLRRGQRSFRDALLNRYGRRCVITGCPLVGVLEAAHLRPYRGEGDNHPSNGLLLRSDLHTLFDLDLIGINPDHHRIVIHPTLRGTEYEQYDGEELKVSKNLLPDETALRARWSVFCAAC